MYGRECQMRDEDSFLDLGIIDSSGLLELVNFLEKQYGIQVEEADLVPENLDSIAQLARFLRRKLELQLAPVASQRLQHQTA
ncbi:MAG: acyl carrier protein [Acidobacteriia bacterium]|nr:acyl carrier protein [Terriglobia bacterium]